MDVRVVLASKEAPDDVRGMRNGEIRRREPRGKARDAGVGRSLNLLPAAVAAAQRLLRQPGGVGARVWGAK